MGRPRGPAKPAQYKHKIGLWVSDEGLDGLDEYCKEHGIELSEAVRRAITILISKAGKHRERLDKRNRNVML